MAAGLTGKFRPTPRELSVSCGQSVLVADGDVKNIIKLFSEKGVVWNNLFELSGEEGAKQYERIGNYEDYQLE